MKLFLVLTATLFAAMPPIQTVIPQAPEIVVLKFSYGKQDRGGHMIRSVQEPDPPMNEPIRVLGIVTARGGSKGIPRKNIVPVLGKPLLAYTAEATRGASLIRIRTAAACRTKSRVRKTSRGRVGGEDLRYDVE